MVDWQKGMADFARARANVYGLLADVFRAAPSEAFLETLRSPEFSGALNDLGPSLDGAFEGTDVSGATETLALEYTRLFLGPGSHISPHESMHLPPRFGEQKQLWGDATVAVKKFIEATGLHIADKFTGMPDHITAEVEFMQQLALKEAEAWAGNDAALGDNIRGIQARFFDEHLSRWIPAFCDQVAGRSSSPFYVLFSELAKEFSEFETQNLAQPGGVADAGERLPA